MKAVEAAALEELGQIKHELMLVANASQRVKYEQVCAHYCDRLKALALEHKRRKQVRDRKRCDYLKSFAGEALEHALESLRRESQADSAERQALKWERSCAIDSLAESVEAVEERVRELKQQYATLSAQLQQQLQAAYFADLESGKITIEPLIVLYRDADLIAVDKPAGLLSVPGRRWNLQDSVVSRLRYQMPNCSFLQAVHRLDRDTSGVMAIALSPAVHAALSQQFAKRHVRKVYQAILSRPVRQIAGVIDLPLRPDSDHRPKQRVDFARGKPSQTAFRRLVNADRPRIELTPRTGRTHQLRVHMAHKKGLSSPIVGDALYGKPVCSEPVCSEPVCGEPVQDTCDGDSRLLLHAMALEFVQPITQETLSLSSTVPF